MKLDVKKIRTISLNENGDCVYFWGHEKTALLV